MSSVEPPSGPLMWSEMMEQGGALLRVIASARTLLKRKARHGPLSSRFLSRTERVITFGSGSSYHAACLARDYLVRVSGVPAQAVHASEAFRFPETSGAHTLALAFSHSGRSAAALAAARRARHREIPTAAITNADDSPLEAVVDACWVTGAGREKAVPSTKGFTAAAAAALVLAFHAAASRGVPGKSLDKAARLVSGTARKLDGWLAGEDRLEAACRLIARAGCAAFVGAGLLYPVACDGALKLMEIAYIPALAYPPEELRHGPVALADEGLVLVGLVPRRRDTTLLGVMEAVSEAGATVVAVGATAGRRQPTGAWVELPRVDPLAAPLVYMPSLQMIAHGVGARLGRPIDRPRNLSKVVGAR